MAVDQPLKCIIKLGKVDAARSDCVTLVLNGSSVCTVSRFFSDGLIVV